MFDRSLDSQVFFSDFEVVIVFDGREIKAIPDKHDEQFKNSRVSTLVLRVLTSDSQDIDTDSVITKAGSTYRVYKKDVMRDGLFTKLEAERKNG
jgi:hypothetical protein